LIGGKCIHFGTFQLCQISTRISIKVAFKIQGRNRQLRNLAMLKFAPTTIPMGITISRKKKRRRRTLRNKVHRKWNGV
jgi:hypothetical protein